MIKASPAGLKAVLKVGKAFRVATVARINSGSRETRYGFDLSFFASSSRVLRNASRSVMSASSVWVTCGTFTQDACSRGPEMRLMRDSGTVSTGPNLAKSTTGTAGRAPPPATAPADLARAALMSSLVMRPFSPAPLIELRSMSSSRASRRTAGPAKTPEKSGFAGPGADAGVGAGGGDGADDGAAGGTAGPGASAFATAGGLGAGAASAPAASIRAISTPIETLSPTLVTTSATVPAIGEGTSIVALSDSSVTSDWSTLTLSPGFTSTSMTGTSLKSPMSGTFTSIFATGGLLRS